MFSTSNLSNATTPKPRTEAKEDYRQRRQIAMTQFLLNECGLSEAQVSDLASRRAKMFRTKSTLRAQQAIEFFRDSGFTENQVRKILCSKPVVLSLKVDTQLKPKIEFLKELGFTDSNLGLILSIAPNLLCISLERNLSPRIPILVSLFGSKLNLCKALVSPSIIFTNSEEALKSKIEYVRNLGVLEGSKAFAYTLMAVDSSGPEEIENKLKHMATFGLLENEIVQIVKRAPITLAVSIEKMKNNMDFLKHIAGFQPNIVVMHPHLLNFSVKNRMQPRHKVIEFLRETEPSKLSTNLARVYELTDQVFARKFLVGSPEAAKLFENYKGKSDDTSIS
ncbi:hypothetical protein SUGI_0213970 [Cryptomeria japonica]|nr:hypothetical protein SUGI_0213970 [Cryptomeria japonica]